MVFTAFVVVTQNNTIIWNDELYHGIIDSSIRFFQNVNHLYPFKEMSAGKHLKLR